MSLLPQIEANGEKMRAEIINPFISATIEVLKSMAYTDSIPGKPFLKNDYSATGDVTSIVGITGEPDATFSITFDSESILCIVSKMFGETLTELTQEVADATGEIVNMISGKARREMDKKGIHYDGAIPTIITGQGHEIKHISEGPVIAIPFQAEKGSFTMEICFKS